ncbi:frizzled-6 isoform X2 [Alosa sapidissima]|uniref:frizzled-6 isoform X2 n=1 Tax=Alosa sapidissima TaxID=34773 RepID=UPI001C085E3A|nr:frizzled-6 isoform X2 [Alosa sapidissima]
MDSTMLIWRMLHMYVVLQGAVRSCYAHSLFTCEPSRVQWCHGMPYNMTFFPNMLGHYDQDIAAVAMKQFMPLANLQCSPDAHLFLCQAFVPECNEPTVVLSPCRELCERVHSDCKMDMQVFGLSWPPELQCDRLNYCQNSLDGSIVSPTKHVTTPKSSPSSKRDLGFWCPMQLKTQPGQAGIVWWVILTITWFLAAGPKWSCEAIEKKAVWFHSVAWGLPGALTIILLALDKVEGDSISGVCFVGLYDLVTLRWFVLAPLCVGVLTGLALLLAGIVSLNNVRQVIQHDEQNQEKLKKFMIRIGVFSGLYLLPLLTLLGCYLYEQGRREAWEHSWINDRCRDFSIPCSHKRTEFDWPDLSLFLIKYLMTLVVGISAVFWVSSKKTCSEWAIFFKRTHKKDAINESRRVLQESCEFFLKHNSRVQHKKKHYMPNSHKLKVISKSMGTSTGEPIPAPTDNQGDDLLITQTLGNHQARNQTAFSRTQSSSEMSGKDQVERPMSRRSGKGPVGQAMAAHLSSEKHNNTGSSSKFSSQSENFRKISAGSVKPRVEFPEDMQPSLHGILHSSSESPLPRSQDQRSSCSTLPKMQT